MLRHEAIARLLDAGDPALAWAVGHDLLDEPLPPEALWELPDVERLLRHQSAVGSWPYPGAATRADVNEDYAQLATYQHLRLLVSKYRLDRRHPAIARAASYVLSHQARQGDIRGIYGSQYSPNYTADLVGLLVAAGYAEDRRVLRALDWLLAMRQDDGGWAIPTRTDPALATHIRAALGLRRPVEPARDRPSSHLVTGIVLRGLAAHPRYRHRRQTRAAAELLATRFFMPDRYPDHRSAACWTKLTFPFRWTDLVSSLDSISLVDPKHRGAHTERALEWLASRQQRNGLWLSGYRKTRDRLVDHWVTFAVLRVFKRFYGAVEISASPARRAMRTPPAAANAA